MKRLFWAIGVDAGFASNAQERLDKTKLAAKKKGMEFRWTPPENYHVTLCFLGNVEEEKISQLVSAAREVALSAAPFELKVKGAGAFPNIRSARVVYLGVQAKRELIKLREDLGLACQGGEQSNFEEEYRPHLTIGRLKDKKALGDILSPLAGKAFGKLEVDEIVLYESKLSGGFPVYTPLERIQLGEL